MLKKPGFVIDFAAAVFVNEDRRFESALPEVKRIKRSDYGGYFTAFYNEVPR
jgi:hypothetical protein